MADKLVKYLRQQAYHLNQMADEIEQGLPISCDWCVDLDMKEFEAEMQAIEGQAALHYEHEQAVGEEAA